MLRHVLPVVAGATALLFFPATASATPAPAPVENQKGGWSHSAVAEDVPLADGRMATVHLSASADPSGTRAGYLSVQLWTPYACADSNPMPWWPGEPVPEPQPGTCKGGLVYAFADLTGEQLHFDATLRSAVAEAQIEVPVSTWLPPSEHVPDEGDPIHPTEPTDPIEDGWGDPWGGGWTEPDDGGSTDLGGELPVYEPATTTLTMRVEFAGTGRRDTQATHQTMCGDGMRECQSIRIGAVRDALTTVTVDGRSAPAVAGRMYRNQSLDLAAPKFVYPA